MTLLQDLQASKDTEAAGRLYENVHRRSSKLARGTRIYKGQTETKKLTTLQCERKKYFSSKNNSARRILTFPAVYIYIYTQFGMRNPMLTPKLSVLSV